MADNKISGSGILILGGTAGVGLETAAQFAAQGARVVLLGRNADRGTGACTQLRARVPDAWVEFVKADVLDAVAAQCAEQQACALLGSIDVLVCTTGPSRPPSLLQNIPIEDIKSRLEEIILPPLHMMHAVLPGMRAQKSGAIVNVASDAAKVATPGETLIGAAMAAILQFSRAAALEEKRDGIRINVLTPPLIASTPGAALIFAEPFSARMFEKAAKLAHLGVPESEDLASMILYLASPAARRITGQAISINGGIPVA
jgi:NAD(P)-dependent dehydrogenase (short-subunit alcohol dehydrogenase family)